LIFIFAIASKTSLTKKRYLVQALVIFLLFSNDIIAKNNGLA